MTATLIPHRQRRPPRMERVYAFWFRCWLFLAPIDDAADEHVEEWCEEKSKEGDAKHSREHSDAHHPPHLCARSTCNNQWYDARNECKRSHQNRTQSDPSCLERGGKSIAALTLQIARELDDKNRVLARKPDEHEQPD